jgi:hypothetical protein
MYKSPKMDAILVNIITIRNQAFYGDGSPSGGSQQAAYFPKAGTTGGKDEQRGCSA